MSVLENVAYSLNRSTYSFLLDNYRATTVFQNQIGALDIFLKSSFRLHKDRVYYVSEELMKRAASCARENLISFGVCFGKFTKTKKFRLQITALDYLAPYAQYKLWVSWNKFPRFGF